MSKKKSSSKLVHYIKAPIRALARARGMYINGFMTCTDKVQQGRSFVPPVPRSQSHGFYSASSRSSTSDEDLRDLIRAASQGTLGSLNLAKAAEELSVVPRSQSVAAGVRIARIDEDQPCEFNDEVMYPRSRSCAVAEKRRRVGGVVLA